MGKKQAGSIPNKAIYSRLSYLYQAATYLQSQVPPKAAAAVESQSEGHPPATEIEAKQPQPLGDVHAVTSRRLISDLRAASLKTQIRIDPSIKRTACKYCDTLFIEGSSCRSFVENRSKGGRKPWADVMVRQCGTCGREKRFPVSAARQKRRPLRGDGVKGEEGGEGEGLARGKKGALVKGKKGVLTKGNDGVPVRGKEEVPVRGEDEVMGDG